MPIFSGSSKENLLDFLRHFEILGQYHNWNAKQKGRTLPLCLKGRALALYSKMSNDQKRSYRLIRKKLIKRLLTEDVLHRKRVELHNLKQGDMPVEEYVKKLDNFFRELQIADEHRYYFLTAGLNPSLPRDMLLKKPSSYESAISCLNLKEAAGKVVTETVVLNKKLLEELKLNNQLIKEQNGHTTQQRVRVNYADPIETRREVERLEKQLKIERNKNKRALNNGYMNNNQFYDNNSQRNYNTHYKPRFPQNRPNYNNGGRRLLIILDIIIPGSSSKITKIIHSGPRTTPFIINNSRELLILFVFNMENLDICQINALKELHIEIHSYQM